MKNLLILVLIASLPVLALAQQSTENKFIEKVEVSTTKAVYLGLTQPVSELNQGQRGISEKRNLWKSKRSVPDNFKGRGKTKVEFPELEHQGPDKIRQSESAVERRDPTVPLVNMDGITNGGSPTDPSGDIGRDWYMQAINATAIAIYDKEGNQETVFAASQLWAPLGASSLGDPIILYDEQTSQWIVTEFTGPTDLLIAVSETSSPLGSFHVYRFSVPNFPDYPKYGIWSDHLVVTTNEEGRGTLHQYFIDREALMTGADDVSLQRVAVTGSTGTEQNFLTSTPVDWNGELEPDQSSPIVLLLDDSSWGVAPEDGLRLMRFNVDMENENNTTVEEIFIPMSPYDSFPCAAVGAGFACIPQRGGNGIDGLPELILNVPHYRRFETHESLVFSFVTDATDGDNVAGIRWTELRRTAEADWSVFQEGTYAPDDGLHRWMSGIAMDKFGHIGMAYSVSGFDDFAGLRYTGRRDGDPLGLMTIPETTITDGFSTINSGGRFGDYTQMSVDSETGSTFWFTGEYAGSGGTNTRIVAFELARDTFDVAVFDLLEPGRVGENLTAAEQVTTTINNSGLEDMTDPTVTLWVDGVEIASDVVSVTLSEGETFDHTFSSSVDLSAFGAYDFRIEIAHPDDGNPVNNVFEAVIENLPSFDLSVDGRFNNNLCPGINPIIVTVTNEGFNTVTNIDVNIFDVNNGNALVGSETISAVPGQGGSTEVEVDIDFAEAGDFRYRVEVSSDDIMEIDDANNAVEVTTSINDSSVSVILDIQLDNFPDETSYEVFSPTTFETLYEGSFGENDTSFSLNMCLDPSLCYILFIRDSYGDGICCTYGIGSFGLTYENGDVLLIGDPEFGTTSATQFCPDGRCVITAEVTTQGSNSQNNGVIMIDNVSGEGPYQYSIDGGATFQDSNVFTGLASGEYDVEVIDGSGNCAFMESVLIEVLSSTSNDQVFRTINAYPNPSEDIIHIEMEGVDLGDFVTLQVHDSNGRLIQDQFVNNYSGTYKTTISLMDRPSGTYYLSIKENNQVGLSTIIKL